ncbi:MAG: phospholipid carrier-dependent glycosyltransferase [Candidatus Saccharibacteria bacterium]
MNSKRIRPELIALIIGAIFTRTFQLFQPKAIVFDEVYFKAFAGHYLDGHYFFDIHPPLGKLILAGWAHICGLSGVTLATTTALPLRLIPALFGITLIPIVWAIIRNLGGSRKAAFLGGFMVLLDNALIVESRFILTDTILLATGLGAILCYLIARKRSGKAYYAYFIASAFLAGASASTKWTGLTSLALIAGLWLYESHTYFYTVKWFGRFALLIITPALLYIGLFAIHFALLPSSGDGDAFMSARFQSTLIGNTNYSSNARVSFPAKFVELNHEMYEANKTLTATHPYGSHWYSWPLELRPIYYWQGETLASGKQGNIYLLGNPAIWWGSLVAMISGLIIYFARRPKRTHAQTKAVLLLVLAYLMNYLPFAAVTRVMFLYHYFFSLVFEIILAVLLWDFISKRSDNERLMRYLYFAIITLITIFFLYFSPLTYGFPLTTQGLMQHIWIHTWR